MLSSIIESNSRDAVGTIIREVVVTSKDIVVGGAVVPATEVGGAVVSATVVGGAVVGGIVVGGAVVGGGTVTGGIVVGGAVVGGIVVGGTVVGGVVGGGTVDGGGTVVGGAGPQVACALGTHANEGVSNNIVSGQGGIKMAFPKWQMKNKLQSVAWGRRVAGLELVGGHVPLGVAATNPIRAKKVRLRNLNMF